ncbi:MAG: LamG-like jellyroll fold domain-containing protein, partial [Limisphaerales bacterium]
LITIASNNVALLYQRVGANTPLLSTPGTGATNGMISQWHFFIFTNDVNFALTNATNVGFVTFLPPNLSQSRLQEPPGVAPRGSDGADIDLYVSTDPRLLDLNPDAIYAADKSTLRGGTEFVTYTNSTQGQVYYIGVKAEDQQAAEFGFFGLATDQPFDSTDPNGQLQLHFSAFPAVIPDGYPALPSKVFAMAIVQSFSNPHATARRVVISQSITHELLGDLYGTLTHSGHTVVLNNHTLGHQQQNVTNVIWTYDDSDEGDVINPPYPGHIENNIVFPQDWMHTDGPGTLRDFVDKPVSGPWIYEMTDNALNNTGQVNIVQGWVDPNPATNVLHQVRTIQGNGWFYDFLNLPDDTTNLNIAVTYQSGSGSVDIYLRKYFFPSPTNYDATTLIKSPGGSLNVNITNTPPISGGFWIYGIHNNSGSAITIAIDITITRSLTPDLVQTVTNKTATVLLDDAVTTSQILINKALPVVGVEVGLRLDHPRLSDLSIELVSPQGTHVMLFEDRGYTNATALGLNTSNGPIYTIFTEDTNKASQLIKFALPPYAQVNAVVSNTVIFSNGFETALSGTYSNGSVVEAWNVITNEAGVVADAALANSGTNFLALGSGAINRSFATKAGKNYLLSHSYRGAGVIGWWPGEGNANDIIGTNNGTFTNMPGTPANAPQPFYVGGAVGKGFHFDGANTVLNVNTNVGNFGTSNFSVEFWIWTTSTRSSEAVMEKRDVCSAGHFWEVRMGVCNGCGGGTNNTTGHLNFSCYGCTPFVACGNWTPVVASTPVNDGRWHHVACVRNGLTGSIYIDGRLDATFTGPGPTPPDVSNNDMFRAGQSTCGCCGVPPFTGDLDEITLYNRALSAAEIYDIFAAGSAGKRTPTSVLPNVDYLIDGTTNDTLVSGTGGPWVTNTIGFTASNSVTQLTIQGHPLGMLLDNIIAKELPNTNYANYFFPEESLSAFNGELASGVWTLEIHDARGGQSGKLLDWELNLTYSSANVHLITVVPGVTNCATAPAGDYAYFAVDVPALAKFATNTLTTAGPNPLNLIFNQITLPTGFSQGDFYLMANVGAPGAVTVLSKNTGPPFLIPGQRYFLAVQNLTAQDQPFCLQVDFDVNTNFTITSLDDSVNNPVTTNVAPGSIQYYSFDVTNSVAVFQVTNISANVDMVIRHGLPLPDSNSYDYGSFNSTTNDEFIVITTNSSPVVLAPGRWYVTVYNVVTNPTVTYTIVADQFDTYIKVFDLTAFGCLSGMIAPPGPAFDTIYTFTVTTNVAAIEFDVTGMTGDVDLLVRLGDYPTTAQFDAASFNRGLANERIVISTNRSRPSLIGTWYAAVPNNEPNYVNYDICAQILPPGTLPFPSVVSGSAGYTSTTSYVAFSFSWSSIAGQVYNVDMSTNLVNWSTVTTIRAESSTTMFNDSNPPDASRYYRVQPQQ